MPRGIPKKKPIVTPKAKEEKEVVATIEPKEPVHEKAQAKEEKPVLNALPPLEPTQQYFEAPDGTVLVGEKSATRLWYRKGEIWINPKR